MRLLVEGRLVLGKARGLGAPVGGLVCLGRCMVEEEQEQAGESVEGRRSRRRGRMRGLTFVREVQE